MNDSDVKIVVAAHKPYWMPDDPMYVPLHVGAAGNEDTLGFQRDDVGINISDKNSRYSELTGMYWAWKNLDSDYIGLSHYRRQFKGDGQRHTLTYDGARELLRQAPVVLPKKRNYYIETVESHYSHTFDSEHLDILRSVLEDESPEMKDAFESHLKERSAHIWNMQIMRHDINSAWCEWVFPILAKVEERIDFSEMSPFQERVIGRLSERLLDPWLDANEIPYIEAPVISLEKTNWVKKGMAFMMAKTLGKKYQESF